MRVLIHTLSQKAHLYIATPLAWSLRTAGHEVCVVGQPDLAEVVDETGLTAAGIGTLADVEVAEQMSQAEPVPAQPAPSAPLRNPQQSDYVHEDPTETLDAIVSKLLPAISPDDLFDDLVRFAGNWKPDLVIWDMLGYAGPVAARVSGAAHARLVLATDGMAQLRSAFFEGRNDPDHDPMRDWLQPYLERFGCTGFDEEIVLGQFSIDTMPDWTWHQDNMRYVSMRHVPFNGSVMIPDWLYEPSPRRRICLTLGMSHRDAGRPEASSAELLKAVADLDVDVVATLDKRQCGALEQVPDNVRITDFVPMNALLATCSAVVHHGGGGTFAGAVEHGVPQLIVPSAWWTEKYYGPVAMANGVTEQGAGIYVSDSDQLTAAQLRASLTRVLDDPSFAANANRLRDEYRRMPTPNEAIPVLERLTARYLGTGAPPGTSVHA